MKGTMVFHYGLSIINAEFIPPLPREITRALFILYSLASFLIKFKPLFAGLSKFIVGGTKLCSILKIVVIISTAPDAPNRLPNIDLGQLAGIVLALAPKTCLIAATSPESQSLQARPSKLI